VLLAKRASVPSVSSGAVGMAVNAPVDPPTPRGLVTTVTPASLDLSGVVGTVVTAPADPPAPRAVTKPWSSNRRTRGGRRSTAASGPSSTCGAGGLVRSVLQLFFDVSLRRVLSAKDKMLQV
jgi:hypothetical protein